MSAERMARARALQGRVTGLAPPLPETPDALFKEIRKHLWKAVDRRALRTSQQEIKKLLKSSDKDREKGHIAILGGVKNQKRREDRPHFKRDDGAWFDFSITVSHRRGAPLTLLAYNFEIRFPDLTSPAYLRFDVNMPGHDNEQDGLRSHIHPGSDDLQVPAPFMSPLEVLDMIVYGLRVTPGRKPRSPRP